MASVIEPDFSQGASSNEWEKFFNDISKNSAFFKSYDLELLREIIKKFKHTQGYVPDDHTIWQLEYDLEILINIDTDGNISYEEKPPIAALRQKVLEILGYIKRRRHMDQLDEEDAVRFNDRLSKLGNDISWMKDDMEKIKKEITILIGLINTNVSTNQLKSINEKPLKQHSNELLNFNAKQWAVLFTTIVLVIILIFWSPFYKDISWYGDKVYDTIHYIQTLVVALAITTLGVLSIINLKKNDKTILDKTKSFSIIHIIRKHKVGFICFLFMLVGTTLGLIINSTGITIVSTVIPLYIFIINYAIKQNK